MPILVHFQEVDHFPGEGTWSPGYAKTFASILKSYPKTTFIGHADAFWANVSADYRNEAAYPTGPVKRGGVSQANNPAAARIAGRCVARETLGC